MEADLWSVEEADNESFEYCHHIVLSLSLSYVTIMEPVLLYCILMCVRFV